MRRVWPLLFSALALIGILHFAPTLYEDFKFARDGVAAYGWYTDLEAQNKYIHYAYQVRDQTLGGQESWDDENSDIYHRHNGDKLEVSYLAHTPWISRRRWGMQNRWQDSKKWAEIYFAMFLAGIVLSLVSRRKQSDLAVKKPSEIGNVSRREPYRFGVPGVITLRSFGQRAGEVRVRISSRQISERSKLPLIAYLFAQLPLNRIIGRVEGPTRARIRFMVDTARSRGGHNTHETQNYSNHRRLVADRIRLGRWKSKDACARVHAED